LKVRKALRPRSSLHIIGMHILTTMLIGRTLIGGLHLRIFEDIELGSFSEYLSWYKKMKNSMDRYEREWHIDTLNMLRSIAAERARKCYAIARALAQEDGLLSVETPNPSEQDSTNVAENLQNET